MEWNLAKFCHLFDSDQVKNFRFLSITTRGPKTGEFLTTYKREYSLNETKATDKEKKILTVKGSTTLSRNLVNFGRQTAEISLCILNFCHDHCQQVHKAVTQCQSTKLFYIFQSEPNLNMHA